MAYVAKDKHFFLTRDNREVGPVRIEGELAFVSNGLGNGYYVYAETGMIWPDEHDKTPLDLVKDLGPVPCRRPGAVHVVDNAADNRAPAFLNPATTWPYRPAPETPVRVQILQEGARLTNGDRDAEYGKPSVNMAAAAALKAAFRQHLAREMDGAELEAIDLALTKLGRIATGAKPKRDTYVDAATYIAIAGEIALADGAPEKQAAE